MVNCFSISMLLLLTYVSSAYDSILSHTFDQYSQQQLDLPHKIIQSYHTDHWVKCASACLGIVQCVSYSLTRYHNKSYKCQLLILVTNVTNSGDMLTLDPHTQYYTSDIRYRNQLNTECEYFNGYSTCYHISTDAMNFTQSRSYCNARAMTMCVIETWQEMMYFKFVFDHELETSDQLWVSLERSDRCSDLDCFDWIYQNGSTLPLNYTAEGEAIPWGQNQPNNYLDIQDCGELNFLAFPGISDIGCGMNRAVICEKTVQMVY